MYIGLVDYDLNAKASIPNLELMKISTYHKFNRDIVELFTNLKNVEKYSKIYLRKENMDLSFPYLFLSQNREKVICGGKAYAGGNYIPMAQEIEDCTPDYGLYDKQLKNSPRLRPWLTNISSIRLQTTGVKQFDPANKKIMVYDIKPNQYESLNELIDLAAQYNKKISFREHLYTEDENELLRLLSTDEFKKDSIVEYPIYLTGYELDKIKRENGILPYLQVYAISPKFDNVTDSYAVAELLLSDRKKLQLLISNKSHIIENGANLMAHKIIIDLTFSADEIVMRQLSNLKLPPHQIKNLMLARREAKLL